MSEPIQVPHDALKPETLEALVEEFITREGTDYGHHEHTLAQKTASVLRQLKSGDVRILFDPESESTTLVRRER